MVDGMGLLSRPACVHEVSCVYNSIWHQLLMLFIYHCIVVEKCEEALHWITPIVPKASHAKFDGVIIFNIQKF